MHAPIDTPRPLEVVLETLEDLSRTPREIDALPAPLRARLIKAIDDVTRAERARRRRTRENTRQAKRDARRHRREAPGPSASMSRKARRRRDRERLEALETDTTIHRALSLPLEDARPCRACKQPFRRVTHSRYPGLCPECTEAHLDHRGRRADLRGYRALVTGGRIKIGFETALKLLRAGAEVHVTTRFPRDAARRFAACSDAPTWRARLQIHGLDLRHLPTVLAWLEAFLEAVDSLEILINNAAQTVRRPAEQEAMMWAREDALERLLSDEARGWIAATPALKDDPQRPTREALVLRAAPLVLTGVDGDPLDLRPTNSWRQDLEATSMGELVETHLINAIAPAMLCKGLLPLMQRSRQSRRFIVNVSAVEGQFSRGTKTAHHPHTNMSKAALNMLTRTSARALAREGIYMNSVDTGWVTDMRPVADLDALARRRRPPLDEVDGAARVCHPIFEGVERRRARYGQFLKDYVPVRW